MEVVLVKEFRFEAAHRLPEAPENHKCRRLHGHSFRVAVQVRGEVDPTTGWLMDYAAISAIVAPLIDAELDHRYLNDVPGLANPTSENLAHWLWERLKPQLAALDELEVAETCTATCRYRGK